MTEYKTNYKGHKIEIRQAEEEIQGIEGYEAVVTPRFCKSAISMQNFHNKSQALSYAKEAIDSKEVPREFKLF